MANKKTKLSKMGSMKITALFLTLVAVSVSQRCGNTCDPPNVISADCICECATSCEAAQDQDQDTCACIDRPQCSPCTAGADGWAASTDFQQSAYPACECAPAPGMDPCDPKYGGLFAEKNKAKC